MTSKKGGPDDRLFCTLAVTRTGTIVSSGKVDLRIKSGLFVKINEQAGLYVNQAEGPFLRTPG